MDEPNGNDITAIDRSVVTAQIGREPRALEAIAARCVHGYPAVTKQSQTDAEGRPFPTAYYLTCPHLVRQIDRIESNGGIRKFEALLEHDEQLRSNAIDAAARHAAIDNRGCPIAQATNPLHVKCLHAHAAFALGAGEHTLGSEVLREASPRWCSDARCASIAGGSTSTSK